MSDVATVGILALLLRWRVLVSFAASAALAVAIVRVFPWFSGLQGIVFACLGVAAGAIWDDSANGAELAATLSDSQTSLPVAVSASALAGLGWGFFSASSGASFAAGAIVLVAALACWLSYVQRRASWMLNGAAALCCVCSAASYGLGGAVGAYAL